MFRKGFRIVLTNPYFAGDALQGTQHLLTQAGRQKLQAHYRTVFKAGAGAVVASLDTTVRFLDRHNLFEDYSRDNDLSYYVVREGEPKELQNSGYSHCVPRTMVSEEEKGKFATLLSQLAVQCTAEAREGHLDVLETGEGDDGGVPLVGARVDFAEAGGGRHTGRRDLERQIVAAAKEAPDFFAVHGCVSPEGVAVVAEVLEEHARREHFGTSVSKTGIRKPNPQPSWTGFDIPAVLFSAAAPGDSFTATVDAAAKAKRIVGVSSPALLGDDAIESLAPLLFGTGTVLAAPTSEGTPTEVVVLA